MEYSRFAVALGAMLVASSTFAATWITDDPDNWHAWSESADNWQGGVLPAPKANVITISAANQTSLIRIGAADKDYTTGIGSLLIGKDGGSAKTSIVEVVTGGLLTMNDSLRIGGNWGGEKGYYEFRIAGGTVSNVNKNAYGPQLGRCPGTTVFTMTGGLYYNCMMTGSYSVGSSYFNLLGGRFVTERAHCISSRGRFVLDGATVLGSLSAQGGVRIRSGGLGNLPGASYGISDIENEATGLFDDNSFLIENGCVTNQFLCLYAGYCGMTNGLYRMISEGALRIYPRTGKKATFCMLGSSEEMKTKYVKVVFGKDDKTTPPGEGEFLQYGGNMNVYCGLSFNSTGKYRYVITNGYFRSVDGNWNSAIGTTSRSVSNMNFIIRGTPYVEMAKIWRGSSESASATFTNSVHFGYEIDGRGLSPIVLNRTSDAPLYGWHTLSPYGGLQLVSTNRFALYQFKASGYAFDDSDEISRWPNAALWSTGVIDEGDGLARYGSTLRAAAEIANGYSDGTGVAFGWMKVPRVRQAPGAYCTLRLKVEPQGETALGDIVADLVKGGYAATAEEKGGFNVKVELPMDRVGNRTTDRKVIFDFTTYEKAWDVYEEKVTVRALVKAAAYDYSKLGLVLIVR